MRIIRVLAVFMALAAAAGAQQGKNNYAPAGRNAEAAPKTAAAKQPRAPSVAVKKNSAPAESEDDGGVMIDASAEDNDPARLAENEESSPDETERSAAPGGLPASYGQLKGTLNDGGRSLLVLENEEGVISFVQISVGGNSVTWKLISRLRRSAE